MHDVSTITWARGGPHRALPSTIRVRRECLEAALADPELIGLWGGTTEAERREIRRRRMAQGAACNNVQ